MTAAEDFNPTRFIARFQRFTAAADLCSHSSDVCCYGIVHPFAHVAFANSGFSSAANEVENEHHECDDKKDMNESTGDVKRKSAAPKQQKKNGNDE